jgi:hypothetical protein
MLRTLSLTAAIAPPLKFLREAAAAARQAVYPSTYVGVGGRSGRSIPTIASTAACVIG